MAILKLICGILCLGMALAAPSRDFRQVCEREALKLKVNHGCCTFCGYEAVLAGDDFICMPSGVPHFPTDMGLEEDDQEEYCQLVAANHGCSDMCGFKFDLSSGTCRPVADIKSQPSKTSQTTAAPIIGGQGKFRYQYMPELLQPPPGASLVNCHGLVTDSENNIYLTYQNDGKDQNCLIKWKPDGTSPEFVSGQNDALCSGTPHGLKIKEEGGTPYLYHANNNQKLTKTTLDGTIIWQVNGTFGQNTTVYRPTWHAVPPNSNYTYLCDGYGSNNVYGFDIKGNFMHKTWGGRTPAGQKGPDAPHGTFSTNHGCTYDSRIENTIIVSDRANSRFEFFHYDPATIDTFEWYHTVNLQPAMGTGTLPCNIRMYPEQDGRAIVPDLAGPVAVMDNNNEVISVVNVSVLLAAEQHKHPHDAIFLPNGDMVVATWAPGRISYWKLLPSEEEQ
eukprot:m.10486 g.10486  ORF g.10486 m.10486 type:complete len:447 (-) comp4269_c0_seq2:187-1527(-)